MESAFLSSFSKRGPLQIDQACGVIRKVAHGLYHAFKQGMVHRDIKPQNIMVTRNGRVRILDFGLARLVREREATESPEQGQSDPLRRTADALTFVGSVLGTPDYIAPEQITDAHLADTRADIYSLGCTFYFLLTGHPPYPQGTTLQKLALHTGSNPEPVTNLRPEIPQQVASIVHRMMARNPNDRFQTPIDLVSAIETFTNNSNTSTPTQTGGVRHDLESVGRTSSIPEPTSASPVDDELKPTLKKYTRRHTRGRQSNRSVPWQWISGIILAGCALVAVIVIATSGRDRVGEDGHEPSDVVETSTDNDQETSSPASAANGEWIDLLDDVNPVSDSEGGVWLQEGSTLTAESSQWAKIQLLSDAPDEYDFEVTFTREEGQHSIALIFAAGSNQATFEIDAWGRHLAGLQLIDGRDLQDAENSTQVDQYELINGRQYTATVRVRRNQIEAWLDGSRIATYIGDGSNLSPLPDWALNNPTAIGLGAYESRTIFHRARLKPASIESP